MEVIPKIWYSQEFKGHVIDPCFLIEKYYANI